MVVPIWSVVTWAPVLVTVSEFNRSMHRYRQLSLSKQHGHAQTGAEYGQVLWATHVCKRLVGMAWDWVAVSKTAVAMADPTNILSNVVLVGRAGRLLDDEERMLHLMSAVHALPWHQRLLAEEEAPVPEATTERQRRHGRQLRLAAEAA
ncbi:hypothetical protein [uncultured Aquincola sp.]|uniref:hypothetical protein n=1 Tax=uncultured Aquincola sp. TaxID=886556 RepID=UPI0032B24622|tara:strand:+ start:1635 stop:2081 length:447 start_codon:yes stop_codon:yes gene_type:complete